MAKASSLAEYLPESVFPAERTRLVAEAVDAGAPHEVVSQLQGLPGDHLFESLAEVEKATRPSTNQRLDPDEP